MRTLDAIAHILKLEGFRSGSLNEVLAGLRKKRAGE